jgi:spore maturation protein CgeB
MPSKSKKIKTKTKAKAKARARARARAKVKVKAVKTKAKFKKIKRRAIKDATASTLFHDSTVYATKPHVEPWLDAWLKSYCVEHGLDVETIRVM